MIRSNFYFVAAISFKWLFLVVAQDAYDYPHSQAYKRYVWEEFNIGIANELDIKFEVPVGAKAAAYAAKHKKDHSYPEPAHIKLCRALNSPPVPPRAGKKKRVVIVEEDENVCQGTLKGGSSYAALMRMYASSLVAHIAHVLGRNDIFYQHGCGTRLASKYTSKKKWLEHGTIQQFLPPFLKMRLDESAEKAITPVIRNSCVRCVFEFDEARKTGFENYNTFPTCLFFPSVPFEPFKPPNTVQNKPEASTESVRKLQELPTEPGTAFTAGATSGAKIAPQQAVEVVEPPAALTEAEKTKRYELLGPYSLIMRCLLQTLRYTLREATGELSAVARDQDDFLFKTLSVLNVDGAVIYLDCAASNGVNPVDRKVLSIPYYVYARELSQGVSRIAILTSGRCQKDVPMMQQYALGLKEFVSNVFEEATVSLGYMDSHSAVAYAHMYLAKQLIATPSESVILPMLANRKFKVIVQSEELYPWMPIMVDVLKVQRTGKGFEDHVHFLGTPVYPLREGGNWGEILKKLMRIETREIQGNESEQTAFIADQCKHVRGRWGKWVQDMNYAKIAQYVTPVKGYTGMADTMFKPTPEEPYRKPTTYKWLDAFESSCGVELLNKQSFCEIMKAQNLGRIMFVGDSLTFHWSQSFWKLLGHEDTPESGTSAGVNEGYHWQADINCDPDHKITAIYIRSDNLDIHTKGREDCGDHSGKLSHFSFYFFRAENSLLLLLNLFIRNLLRMGN